MVGINRFYTVRIWNSSMGYSDANLCEKNLLMLLAMKGSWSLLCPPSSPGVGLRYGGGGGLGVETPGIIKCLSFLTKNPSKMCRCPCFNSALCIWQEELSYNIMFLKEAWFYVFLVGNQRGSLLSRRSIFLINWIKILQCLIFIFYFIISCCRVNMCLQVHFFFI